MKSKYIIAIHCCFIISLIYYADMLRLGAEYGVSRLVLFRSHLPYGITPYFSDSYPYKKNFVCFSSDPFLLFHEYPEYEETQCYYYDNKKNILIIETLTEQDEKKYYKITRNIQKSEGINISEFFPNRATLQDLRRIQIAGNKRFISSLSGSVTISGGLFFYFLYFELFLLGYFLSSNNFKQGFLRGGGKFKK